MMARFGGLVGLWMAIAGDTPAQATVIQLDCKVGARMNSYFQPSRIKVELDTDSGIAQIRDDLTAKVTNGPIKGKIETFNDIRLTILWRVKSLPRDPKLSYSPTTANELTQRLTVREGGSGTLVSLTAGQYMNNLREFRADVVCSTGK